MFARHFVLTSLAGVALATLNGCATIVSGRHADVAFHSYPSNAHVTVHDEKGQAVASLNTPGVVSLKRNRRFFLPSRYTATFEAPGHEPARVPIRSTVNPWVLGNVIIGGIPGLVVDSATGAGWKPRQSEIHQHLAPMYGTQLSGPATAGQQTYSTASVASEAAPGHAANSALVR